MHYYKKLDGDGNPRGLASSTTEQTSEMLIEINQKEFNIIQQQLKGSVPPKEVSLFDRRKVSEDSITKLQALVDVLPESQVLMDLLIK